MCVREFRLFEIFVVLFGVIFLKLKLVDCLFFYEEDVFENVIEVYVGCFRWYLMGLNVGIIMVCGFGYKLE